MDKISIEVKNHISVISNIKNKIDHHLQGLDKNNKDDYKKILELCIIGKLLATHLPDYNILEVREKPDFIISNNKETIGLEIVAILEPRKKEKEGFYNNIGSKVETILNNDNSIPNFLVNCYLKNETPYKLCDKEAIISSFLNIIKEYILSGILIENPYISKIVGMQHSKKSISINFGGYMQEAISEELIISSVRRKEKKLEDYRLNTINIQWLVIVIGGLNESSYEINAPLNLSIESKFNKILLFEDFNNTITEIKIK